MIRANLVFCLLFLLMSLGQVAADLYLPSLKSIGQELLLSDAQSQLTITFYMCGYACAQFLWGIASDAYGRRNPLLFGLLTLFCGSLICAISGTYLELYLGRLLQGLGAGAAVVLSRSILVDVYEGVELARRASILSTGNIMVIASAPVIGGYVEHYLHWRVDFYGLMIYVGMMVLAITLLYRETNQNISKKHLAREALFANLKQLISSKAYWGYISTVMFNYWVVIAYITASPILFITGLGWEPIAFGWCSVIVGSSFLVGSLMNARLLLLFSIDGLLQFSLSIGIIANTGMFLGWLLGYFNAYVILGPMCTYAFSAGLLLGNAYSKAFSLFRGTVGLSTALAGLLVISSGALSSLLVSYLPDHDQGPISIMMISASVLSMVLYKVLLKTEHQSL